MIKPIIKNIFLLNIFICVNQAALIRNQVPQQLNENYQENSLEEPRQVQEARTSSALNGKDQKYADKVSDQDNSILDNFDYRYPDGSYEFRYELADGQARYERGYFININKHKSLVVVGYYSYRLPNGKYITVFYNADQNGYRQTQAINRNALPDLPRTIQVPEFREDASEDIDVTTKIASFNQISSTTKRNRI